MRGEDEIMLGWWIYSRVHSILNHEDVEGHEQRPCCMFPCVCQVLRVEYIGYDEISCD